MSWRSTALLMAAALTAVVLVALHLTTNYEANLKAQNQKSVQAYKDGYSAGVASVSVPKQCVDWWFGNDNKDRHKQAQKAYCKGKKWRQNDNS